MSHVIMWLGYLAAGYLAAVLVEWLVDRRAKAVPTTLPEKELSREILAMEIQSFLDEREPGDYLRFGGGKQISHGDVDCMVELMLEEGRLWFELCSRKRIRDKVVVMNQVLKLQQLGWSPLAAPAQYTRSWWRGMQLTRWWRDLGEVESADSNGIAGLILETFRRVYGLPCLYRSYASVMPSATPPGSRGQPKPNENSWRLRLRLKREEGDLKLHSQGG